jgi:hypothetical protein
LFPPVPDDGPFFDWRTAPLRDELPAIFNSRFST